ncbi:hypothetical protein NM688_g4566 [Phlebia brevispora]|uniref:Uncharacterized protein n=1 Tax=Phlebia brevispora TaxID=194682 RepID=A0ACC1T2H2_9APHY|nr:hypothetical protein NM688_g4566 [Phlebia brevispora]
MSESTATTHSQTTRTTDVNDNAPVVLQAQEKITTEPAIVDANASESRSDEKSGITDETNILSLPTPPAAMKVDTVVTITKKVTRTFSVEGVQEKVEELENISQEFEAKEGGDDFIEDLKAMYVDFGILNDADCNTINDDSRGWNARGRPQELSAVKATNPPKGTKGSK